MINNKKNNADSFGKQIAEKENRKLQALSENKSVWYGLGMFGMVGWSVVAPTLVGAAVGVWLDKRHPVSFSWTVSLLIIGLFIGCIIAWYWVNTEDKEVSSNTDSHHE